jgi:hypothetical protein
MRLAHTSIWDVLHMAPGQSLPCRNPRCAEELARRANRKYAVSRGMSRLLFKEFYCGKDNNGVSRVWRRA